MSQIFNLRLLSVSSPLLSRLSFPSTLFSNRSKLRSPRTILCYSRRGQRRGTSSVPDMEEEGIRFNKRRAEGKDKSSRPKNLQLKNRKLDPINTICYLQILGTGMDTQDTSPSVLLFFDKQRFIFNAGEGLQRFCTEHKIKLSKIDHMFLTRVCSETAGGLPGLLLTLAGIGEEGLSVNVWGPSDLKYLVDAMKSFIPNAAMVHTHSFGATQNDSEAKLSTSEVGKCNNHIVLIDNEVVRISAIPLRPRYKNDFGEALIDSDISCFVSPNKEEKASKLWDPLLNSSQIMNGNKGPAIKPGDIAVIYACELPDIKGKFDPAKAVELGLRPGPKYRELQLGNSVMSDDLSIKIHPSDVLGPSVPGPIVLLVDCPTPFHIPELLSVQSLNCYYVDSVDHSNGRRENINTVSCIVHLGPSSVTKNVEYQKWIKRFGSTQHIMAGHEIANMEIPIFKSSARMSARLNYLCPQLFPAPGLCSVQSTNNCPLGSNGSCEDSISAQFKNISAENLLKFHLRPIAQLGLDRSVIPSLLNPTEIVSELLSEVPEVVDAAQHVSQLWQTSTDGKHTSSSKDHHEDMVEEPWMDEGSCTCDSEKDNKGTSVSTTSCLSGSWQDNHVGSPDVPACLQNISREDMEIILLGTGSSQPSKYRNVSSILVNLFSKGSVLLDCGEGTLGQLKRRFGVRGADEVVKGLKCIWISHIHADHHTGLARILALRQQLLEGVPHEPLVVIGPRLLKRYLDAYSRLEDLDMQFLDCWHTRHPSWNSSSDKNCSSENLKQNNSEDRGTDTSTSQHLDNTFLAPAGRMQSFWKRPRSPADISSSMPVLAKLKEMLDEAGLEALNSVPVVHCPQAFGVVLKASERMNSIGKAIPGWKLVYSGDTRPCKALIDASHDATVLIHEATFEDSMEDEALQRNHSTTGEAIKVGTEAGAYRIILTHFSQRYPKIPVFDETHMENTCIAFDLMSVNAADLPVLPKVLPYLHLLFRNEMVVDESDDFVAV